MALNTPRPEGLTIDIHAHMIALSGPETEKRLKEVMPFLSRNAEGREIISV